MASIVKEIESLKGKLESWKQGLEQSESPEARQKVVKEISDLLYYWDDRFPGSLRTVFKSLEDFNWYNSDFLSQSETHAAKQVELSKSLSALGVWYKSH